jgi:hypothetical protein
MIFDPTTPEGRKEAVRRARKSKKFAKEMKKLAEEDPDDEPTGKVTRPSEMDLHRDRKGDQCDE